MKKKHKLSQHKTKTEERNRRGKYINIKKRQINTQQYKPT